MTVKRKRSNPQESPFLGIMEGKQARAKAAAKAQELEAQAKLAEATKQVDLAKAATETAIVETEAKQTTNMYLVVGAIVALLIVGLYFIVKLRKV